MDSDRFARVYHREIDYNQVEQQAYVEHNVPLLTADQQEVYNSFCSMIESKKGGKVQLASKFTARIGKNAYLARFFARHVRLLAFDARVNKSLAQETMLASYAARDL